VQRTVPVPLPEMFFGNNSLHVSNDHNFVFEFNPTTDALKCVDSTKKGQLAYSEEWKNMK
ncbi:10559_t:CDS:1, partial [Paraglomus brasilianum]